ncbi:MAG: glyceraldehyde 3-phosphate dehydrogenase NAD-binding domain-containing protein, partial [Methylibium sp.]|nr:glyceraldehyde 3-phosphate dehydrogenase NAD-binding domain-containing protein [Methylibium sp.]
MKVGINGMGRIGRLALRAALGAADRPTDDPRAHHRLDVVYLNELKGGAAATAHLLAFDSVQGRWRADIEAEGERAVHVDGRELRYSAHASPADIPWGDHGVDVVLECTGKFLTPETLQGHLDRGAKRVIVAAPVKVGGVLNVVVGVNHHLYDPARHRIVTAASCTTNCLAPVVMVLNELVGI